MNIRKGDTVLVLAGKDRGKRGTVERVERTKRGFGVVIPGINMAKKHQRPRTRTQQAGILDVPIPLEISNVRSSARAAESRRGSGISISRARDAGWSASASAAESRSR